MKPALQSLLYYFTKNKNTSNIFQYIDDLRSIFNIHHIDMILGDFHINYLNDQQVEPFKQLMNSLNYNQVVKSPTFVSSGSLLDHVYTAANDFHLTQCFVFAVYYSDHDAVKISIHSASQST